MIIDRITVLVTSEVGMLEDFLRLDDPSSPLYGRYVHRVEVRRFTEEQSRGFLRKGFEEEGVKPAESDIEMAIDLFDGIVGWLVLFGRLYSDWKDLRWIIDAAVNTAAQELSKLREREKSVLRAIAEGARSWSEVRR